MLFDEILESLELTHKPKPSTPKIQHCALVEGTASLDELDDAARDKYKRFLSDASRCKKREKLTSGDDSEYGDDASAADFALTCDLLQEGFKPRDAEIILRATRYREKFDEMRGSTTYLVRTFDNAMEIVSESNYAPPTQLPTLSLEHGCISIPTMPPPPRDYVWQGRMVAGHAYALGGFGGVSKSQAALQFAASIALGIPFGNVATKKGSVLLIFGEDDVGEITRRLGAYAAQEKLT